MTDGDAKTTAQAEMLGNRLRKRYAHLSKWARRIGTGAFRLYDRDIPEIPLALDLYGDSAAGSLYRRPYEKDWAEETAWLEAMRKTVSTLLEIKSEHIFIKTREHQRGKAQYEKRGTEHFVREIREGGLVFKVNLSDYLDTGIFLDRRRLRAMIRGEAAGKRVLNLFCYTALFSVYAAAGGAIETDSVDLSNTYLDWARENFSLNGFRADPISPGELLQAASAPGHRLIREDALLFLGQAKAARRRWDLIILDPPAFSNSKKMRKDLDINRDQGALIQRCMDVLAPGGDLIFSVNMRGFKLDSREFRALRITDMTEQLRDEDFRDRRIPACYRFQNTDSST
jgi:23S rRNA G2069 N7-methylase RlmK/C1962 C5-methylase RlmI